MTANNRRWPVPDYPFLFGRISLSQNWSVELPFAFQQRNEDGQMVLWRPGFTIFLSIWNNDNNSSADERLSNFAAAASDGKFDEKKTVANETSCYSYRINEQADDDRVAAFQGFAFSVDGHLQVSIYFDDESDVSTAEQILKSAGDIEPSILDPAIFSKFCFATNMLIEQREDGTPEKLSDVNYMFREDPDSPEDSGWRFFSGSESQEYVDDSENTRIYPVAFVAEIDGAVCRYLESQNGHYERDGDQFIHEE